MATKTFFVYGIRVDISEIVIFGWTEEHNRLFCPIMSVGDEEKELHQKDPYSWTCSDCKDQIIGLTGEKGFGRVLSIVKGIKKKRIVDLGKYAHEILDSRVDDLVSQNPNISRPELENRIRQEFPDYAGFLIRDKAIYSLKKRDAREMWYQYLDASMYGQDKNELADQVRDFALEIKGRRLSKKIFLKTFKEVLPEFKKKAWEYVNLLVENHLFLEDIRNIPTDHLESDQGRHVPELTRLVADRSNIGFVPDRQFRMLIKATDDRIKQVLAPELKRQEDLVAEEMRQKTEHEREVARQKKLAKEARKNRFLKGVLERPKVRVRFQGGRTKDIYQAETRQEVDLLKDKTLVFYEDRVVQVQKAKGGKVSLKEVDAQVAEKEEFFKPQPTETIRHLPQLGLVWVLFKGEPVKVFSLDSNYFEKDDDLFEITSNLQVGDLVVKNNGQKEMILYEVADGGLIGIGSCQKANREEKKAAKAVAV